MKRSWVVFALCFAFPAASATAVAPPEPAWDVRRVGRDDMRAARSAGLDIYTHLFGERGRVVARFNRRGPEFVRAGTRLRVPDLPPGEDYVPLPGNYPPAEDHPEYILIVLDRQFLGVYENGALAVSYPVSTGRVGHATPVGRFRVTRKDAEHVSSVYPQPDGGWPMPWALRFRGGEYWIHGGDLPGHAASHGCVRMFVDDARALFERTEIGVPVRVIRSLGPS